MKKTTSKGANVFMSRNLLTPEAFDSLHDVPKDNVFWWDLNNFNKDLPFFGLTICVTQVPLDERKEIEKLVLQNGGNYSPDLTKMATHLVCDAPEGDKYNAAKRWGRIHIVNRTWFNQSVATRACLNEELYPVQKAPVTSIISHRTYSKIARNSKDSSMPVLKQGNISTVQPTLPNDLSQRIIHDARLLDVNTHILFSPLPQKVPLPVFIGLELCVSQYEENYRQLLQNLLFHVLGGRLVRSLTRKVNYLICKFTEGPKYEAACQWGIQTVTIEWIWECIKQNQIVASSQFLPKEATMSDLKAGMCNVNRYPAQLTGQSHEPITNDARTEESCNIKKEVNYSVVCSKKPRLSSGSTPTNPICKNENMITEDDGVSDVASAIEALLEQISKVEKNVVSDVDL